MQTYQDNFLSDDEFSSLNERMLWRFKPSLRQDERHNHINSNRALRIRTLAKGHDLTESAVLLGKMVPDIVNKVKNYLIDNLKFKNPEVHAVWFQYMSNKQYVGSHVDGKVRNKDYPLCYSTFIFCHNEWYDDWGGFLCFKNTQFVPKRNRLVIYSRDEEHWVSDITHSLDNYQRMFLGMSWSTDNDL